MKRILRLASLLLAITGMSVSAMCVPVRAEPTTEPEAASLGENGIYWGTGFFVDHRGHILTARHVVASCRRIDIVSNGHREPAALVATSSTDDLGLLQVSDTAGTPVAFATDDAPPGGSFVGVTGYGVLRQLQEASDSSGSADLNGIVLDETAPRHLTLASDAKPGSSGSPVIALDGKVVGVLESKLTRDAGVTGAGRVQEIRLAVSGGVAKDFLRSEGVTPIEGDDDDSPRLTRLSALASVEVEVDCHR